LQNKTRQRKKIEIRAGYRLRGYNTRAEKKGLLCNLTIDIVKKLMKDRCFYCGKFDNPNTIDRLDNTKGYLINNCVPCCKICNIMKWDLTYIDFKAHIKLLHNMLK